MILMWHHPKYYQELAKKRKQLEREQASERASEQARRVGGPTSREQVSEQASDQASEEDSSNKRWMWSQSSIAREGVSRWSTSRPGSELLLNNFIHLREGICTSIKLRFVRVKWNNFWCGEKCTLLPFITLSSTIKKPHLSLYPNRSGTPKDAQDSSLVHWILGVFFLTNCQNFDSGFIVHRTQYWLIIVRNIKVKNAKKTNIDRESN